MTKYVLAYIFFQLCISAPLMVVGWLICLSPALAKASWLWWNDVDGSGPSPRWLDKYLWLAWRNPVNNLRFVRGVSHPGWPLFYRTKAGLKQYQFKFLRWQYTTPAQVYIKLGWMPHEGYPACSCGSGRGW